MRPLHVELLRTLAPLSAASGLVVVGDELFVVADDEGALGVFPLRGDGPGRRLPGAVQDEGPADPVARKAWKADLEALVALPGGRGLLALGSGATPARRTAVHWPADGEPRSVDLGPLHQALDDRLDELNLEGACVAGDAFLLAQRGNGAAGQNALASCDLAAVLAAVDAGGPVPASVLRDVVPVTGLGAADDGTPLTLTDLTALPDGRLLATAVAEQGASTYDDGACVAAAVAVLRADGTVEAVHRLDVPWKVEGIAVVGEDDGVLELRLCVDPDDPTAEAPLLRASLRP